MKIDCGKYLFYLKLKRIVLENGGKCSKGTVRFLPHRIIVLCLNIHAWIIMSNHIHLIISCRKGFELSDALRDFKKYTSKKIYAAIKNNPLESRKEWMIYLFDRSGKRNANNTNFQFWQQNHHYEELLTPQMLKKSWIICIQIR